MEYVSFGKYGGFETVKLKCYSSAVVSPQGGGLITQVPTGCPIASAPIIVAMP
jgi:hypothetical protein